MTHPRIITTVLAILVTGTVVAQQHDFKPRDGYVPNSEVAIKIAVAVWEPIYGKGNIAKQAPYHAVLAGSVWTVEGTLPKGALGGVATADIAKEDGKVLRVSHGQ